MTTLLKSILSAFNASIDMHAALDTQLARMSSAQRKAFVVDTANALADAASTRYGEDIQTYDGQRGIAFGVWDAEAGKMVRTPAANTTRMWFVRNIVSKFDPVAPKAEPSAVWSKIVTEISSIKNKGAKLAPKQQRELLSRLAELEAEFFGE